LTLLQRKVVSALREARPQSKLPELKGSFAWQGQDEVGIYVRDEIKWHIEGALPPASSDAPLPACVDEWLSQAVIAYASPGQTHLSDHLISALVKVLGPSRLQGIADRAQKGKTVDSLVLHRAARQGLLKIIFDQHGPAAFHLEAMQNNVCKWPAHTTALAREHDADRWPACCTRREFEELLVMDLFAAAHIEGFLKQMAPHLVEFVPLELIPPVQEKLKKMVLAGAGSTVDIEQSTFCDRIQPLYSDMSKTDFRVADERLLSLWFERASAVVSDPAASGLAAGTQLARLCPAGIWVASAFGAHATLHRLPHWNWSVFGDGMSGVQRVLDSIDLDTLKITELGNLIAMWSLHTAVGWACMFRGELDVLLHKHEFTTKFAELLFELGDTVPLPIRTTMDAEHGHCMWHELALVPTFRPMGAKLFTTLHPTLNLSSMPTLGDAYWPTDLGRTRDTRGGREVQDDGVPVGEHTKSAQVQEWALQAQFVLLFGADCEGGAEFIDSLPSPDEMEAELLVEKHTFSYRVGCKGNLCKQPSQFFSQS
jgi:hypothetical protein